MQARAMRSQIYLPVLRFGITDEDWGIVIAAAIAGYAVPFLFGMKVAGLPLELVGWLVTTGASVFVLNLLRRNSSIAGIYRDALRHRDGAFTRAYHVELSPTVFSDDLVIESRCDAFARMLSARKPVGTIIQFRLTADMDRGLAIERHDAARDPGGIHRDAAILHESGLAKYQTMADLGCFRQTRLTVWVRVPNLHQRVEDQFLPTLKREINLRGFAGLPSAFFASWRATSGEQIVRRLMDEEAAAFEEARPRSL